MNGPSGRQISITMFAASSAYRSAFFMIRSYQSAPGSDENPEPISMEGHLHDRPRSTLVPYNKLMPSDALNRRVGERKRRSAPIERALGRIARRGAAHARGRTRRFGSHLVQRNKPLPSASKRGAAPERRPHSLNWPIWLPKCKPNSAIGDQRRAAVFRPGRVAVPFVLECSNAYGPVSRMTGSEGGA